MKIRNLYEYVTLLTSESNSFELGSEKDTLLKKLYGEGTNNLSFIKQLTAFAKNIHEQVFYEFLQNASDAGGDSFYVFYDQCNLLLMNNGKPFQTNSRLDAKGEPGQLHSFLCKKPSDKLERKGYIGKNGQGSKLIYEFLSDLDTGQTDDVSKRSDVMFRAMTEDLKAPILFSWAKWNNLEGLLTMDFNNPKLASCKETDEPLLTKLLYSYFPAMPGEVRTVAGKGEVTLFTQEEFKQFKDYVQTVFSKFTAVKNSLGQGTMLYLPLGKGHAQQLDQVLKGSLKARLATSQALLEKIREVRINEHRIQEIKYHIKPLTTAMGNKNFRLIYPASVTDFQSDISNFYQYFPITNEQHGFKFILDSNDLEIDSARQNLDLSKPNNRNLVEGMGKAMLEYADRLKQSDWANFLLFYRCLLHTNKKQTEREEYIREKLFKKILEWLQENIPAAAERKVVKKDNALLMHPVAFDIPLQKIGISKQWIHPDLLNDESQLKDLLGLQVSNLYEILGEADEDQLAEWITTLPEKDYRALWQRIADENPHTSDIKMLFCIRASNGTTKSFDEWEDDKDVILLSQRTAGLLPYLKRLGIPYAGEGIVEALEMLNNLVDKETELQKIADLLEEYRESIAPQDKRAIFRILTKHFPDESGLKKVEVFRSVNNKFRKLSDLIHGTEKIAPSGLLSYFQIAEEEYDPCLNNFLMSKEQIWEKLMEEWDMEIREELTEKLRSAPQKLKGITKDIFEVHKMSGEDEQPPDNQPIIWTTANLFASISEIYFIPEFAGLSEDIYQKVADWIVKHSELMVVPSSIRALLKQYDVGENGLQDLADNLQDERIAVSMSDLEVLSHIRGSEYLLNHFIFLESRNGGYELMRKGSRQSNYWSGDRAVNDFFKRDFVSGQRRYMPLPEGLYNFFSNQERKALKIVNEDLVSTWIDIYGAKREFINEVVKQSQQVILKYLDKLQVLEITSNQSYTAQSFESKLLRVCLNDQACTEKLKSILRINGKPYSSYRYEDELSLTVNDKPQSFRLSQILEEYVGTSDIIENVKNSFEDSSVQTFFKMERALPAEVMEKRLSRGITQIEHLLFCVAVACHTNHQRYTAQDIQQHTRLPSMTDESVLESFWKRGLPFKDYYCFKEFEGRCLVLPTSDTFLFVAEERTIDWLEAWLIEGDRQQEKEAFLLANGFHRLEALVDFQLRKAAYSLTVTKSLAEKWVKEQNRSFFSNTLRWLERNFNKREATTQFMNSFIHITTALAGQQDKFQPHHVLTINGLSQNDVYEVAFSKYDPTKRYCYTKSPYGRKNSKLAAACAQQGYQLIYAYGEYEEKWFDMLKAHRIPLAYIEQQLGNVSNHQEWRAAYYLKWKQEHMRGKYTIFLYDKQIPFREELLIGETRINLQGERLDKAGCIKNGDKHLLYLTTPPESASVLQLLEENADELFSTKDDLLKLFALSTIPDNQREILDKITDMGIPPKEVIAKLSNPATASGTETGSGGYDIGKDWDRQAIEKIKNLKDILQQLFKNRTEENLRAALEKVMRWNEMEEDAKPNALSGYFGEQLYYQWLKHDYEQVQYVAQENPQMDFMLNLGGKVIEIDTKTHQRSNRETGSNAVPFYIHKNQWTHLINDKPEHYVIVRISLADIGLLNNFKQLTRGANSEDEQVKQELAALAARFMQDDTNRRLFQDTIVQFRLNAADLV
jgi:hypothetical protein